MAGKHEVHIFFSPIFYKHKVSVGSITVILVLIRVSLNNLIKALKLHQKTHVREIIVLIV